MVIKLAEFKDEFNAGVNILGNWLIWTFHRMGVEIGNAVFGGGMPTHI